MPYYSAGFQTLAANASAYCTLHTGSSYQARITEMGFACNAATASPIALCYANNTPVANVSVIGLAEYHQDPAATVNCDTNWSTIPNSTGLYFRRFMLPATIGAGVVWTWPPDRPLVVPVSTYLVLWNPIATAGSILNGYMKWLE
jgi:hypothetical protein